MITLQTLRFYGYRTRITHKRYYPNIKTLLTKSQYIGFDIPNTKGGCTYISITSPSGIEINIKAECSNKDSFVKKIGVNIALGRAYKELLVNETDNNLLTLLRKYNE